MAKTYDCEHCDQRFRKWYERSSHVTQAHTDRGRLSRVSCWRCARPIDPNLTAYCHCGWKHPYIEVSDPI